MSDKGFWIVVIAIILATIVCAYLKGGNDEGKKADGIILIKQNEITRLNGIIAEQKDIAIKAKEDALKYGKMVAVSNAEIKRLKKQVVADREKMENIKPSESVQETVERLDKLGLKPKVRCNENNP
jgi:hypothetical protein